MRHDFLEDYAVGDVIETPGRTITEADIVQFAMLSGDWHPLHTDAEYAQTTMFGERIAHGMLVLVVGSALGFRLGQYAISPKSFIALAGMSDLVWKAPTRMGDTIRLICAVEAIELRDATRGTLVMNNEIRNQSDVVVCRYQSHYLCGRRPVEIDDAA